MALYTITDDKKTTYIVTEHVAVVYDLPNKNLVCMDNGQKIEVNEEQMNEIIELL